MKILKTYKTTLEPIFPPTVFVCPSPNSVFYLMSDYHSKTGSCPHCHPLPRTVDQRPKTRWAEGCCAATMIRRWPKALCSPLGLRVIMSDFDIVDLCNPRAIPRVLLYRLPPSQRLPPVSRSHLLAEWCWTSELFIKLLLKL